MLPAFSHANRAKAGGAHLLLATEHERLGRLHADFHLLVVGGLVVDVVDHWHSLPHAAVSRKVKVNQQWQVLDGYGR